MSATPDDARPVEPVPERIEEAVEQIPGEAARAVPGPVSPWPASGSGFRAWLPRVIVESVLIVFSVLLALALDSWREERGHRRQAATARLEILNELRANGDAVAESLQYHSGLLEALRALPADSSPPPPQLFSRGFVSAAQISRTAWDSASETGALAHLAYDDVLLFSRAYAQQERYSEQTRSIGQVIYAELFRGGHESIVSNHRNLATIIGTFVYRERQLLQRYDAILGGSPSPAGVE